MSENGGSSLPWQNNKSFQRHWATKSAQTVNSLEYRQLKQYIHMPYRKIDQHGIKCFYFPTYIIFKVKNVTEFDFDILSAKINGVLIIDILVDYKDHFSVQSNKLEESQIRNAIQQLFEIDLNKGKKNKKMLESGESMDGRNANESKSPQKYMETSLAGRQKQNRLSKQSKESQQQDQKKNYLFVQFNRDNPMKLPSKKIFNGQINKTTDLVNSLMHVRWTIRKEFTISLAPGTIFEDLIAPFNLLNFQLTLDLQDVDIKLPEVKDSNKPAEYVKFKFNCMKRNGEDFGQQKIRSLGQLLFTDDGSLGEYDLAQTSLAVKCEQMKTDPNHKAPINPYSSYKIITFNIPFYKYPIMDSLTIFLPLLLLTILTLFTFVQAPDYNDKIANIATLMIVYASLMPVIDQSLPPTTSLTLIDLVVYLQLLINLISLFRGYIIKDYTSEQFDAYRVWSDPLFISSFIIAVITGIVLLFLIIYYCVKKPTYNLEELDIKQTDRETSNWVSSHMFPEARNLKTSIGKVQWQRKNGDKSLKQSKTIRKTNFDNGK